MPEPSLTDLRAVADYLDPPDDATIILGQRAQREVGRWLHELYGSNYERDNPEQT